MCLLVIISFHNAAIRLAWRQSLELCETFSPPSPRLAAASTTVVSLASLSAHRPLSFAAWCSAASFPSLGARPRHVLLTAPCPPVPMCALACIVAVSFISTCSSPIPFARSASLVSRSLLSFASPSPFLTPLLALAFPLAVRSPVPCRTCSCCSRVSPSVRAALSRASAIRFLYGFVPSLRVLAPSFPSTFLLVPSPPTTPACLRDGCCVTFSVRSPSFRLARPTCLRLHSCISSLAPAPSGFCSGSQAQLHSRCSSVFFALLSSGVHAIPMAC